MIDTDKYEGHTEGPWEFTDFDPLHLWGESPIISGGEGYSQNEADWKLIADAPLLLAEVERLRERLIRAYDWAENVVNGNDSAMMDYTEYVCGGEEE